MIGFKPLFRRKTSQCTSGYTLIDAQGGYISPGFVDIHSDYIEGILSPRPTCLMDFNMGIREAERILVSHGITTMFHSLTIYKGRRLCAYANSQSGKRKSTHRRH